MNQSIRRIIMPTMIVALMLSSTIVANAGLNSAREDQIIIYGNGGRTVAEYSYNKTILPLFSFNAQNTLRAFYSILN